MVGVDCSSLLLYYWTSYMYKCEYVPRNTQNLFCKRGEVLLWSAGICKDYIRKEFILFKVCVMSGWAWKELDIIPRLIPTQSFPQSTSSLSVGILQHYPISFHCHSLYYFTSFSLLCVYSIIINLWYPLFILAPSFELQFSIYCPLQCVNLSDWLIRLIEDYCLSFDSLTYVHY